MCIADIKFLEMAAIVPKTATPIRLPTWLTVFKTAAAIPARLALQNE